ncbi:MAG: hypothetical protein ACFFDF_23355 [Candidatus Odinarchaeota archaeon]
MKMLFWILENGCLWCYRPRMTGSLYCCLEHRYKYEWYNGKPEV